MKKTLNYDSLMETKVKISLEITLEEALKNIEDDILILLNDGSFCHYNRFSKTLTKRLSLENFLNEMFPKISKTNDVKESEKLHDFNIWEIEEIESPKLIRLIIETLFKNSDNSNIDSIYTFLY